VRYRQKLSATESDEEFPNNAAFLASQGSSRPHNRRGNTSINSADSMCSDRAKKIFESLKSEPDKPLTSNQFSRIGPKDIMKADGKDLNQF